MINLRDDAGLKKALVVAGTRPEIIKLSRVLSALSRRDIPYNFIYVGQHRDYEMSSQFIQELKLPVYTYKVLPSKLITPASQTAHIMTSVERSIVQLEPSLVIVQGDTNTTLAASIAAAKQPVPIAHIEAGLRSYDWRMPEEHNRRMVDHISTLLFAPTRRSGWNLFKECVIGATFITGNTVIDSVIHYLPVAQRYSKIMDEIRYDEYILATFHRAENVDNPSFLADLMDVMKELPLPVIFPIHPRTLKRLREYGLMKRLKNLSHKVRVLPPLGYFDFLVAMKNCHLIMTDSGGVQEEATAPGIRKMTVVVRKSTERPEAIEAGLTKLAGVEKEQILEAIHISLKMLPPNGSSPFGDGNASEIIASIINDFLLGGKISRDFSKTFINIKPNR